MAKKKIDLVDVLADRLLAAGYVSTAAADQHEGLVKVLEEFFQKDIPNLNQSLPNHLRQNVSWFEFALKAGVENVKEGVITSDQLEAYRLTFLKKFVKHFPNVLVVRVD